VTVTGVRHLPTRPATGRRVLLLVVALLAAACAAGEPNGSDEAAEVEQDDRDGDDHARADAPAVDAETCEQLALLTGPVEDDVPIIPQLVERAPAATWLAQRHPDEGFGPYAGPLERLADATHELGLDLDDVDGEWLQDQMEERDDEDRLFLERQLHLVARDYADALLTPPASQEFARAVEAHADVEDACDPETIGAQLALAEPEVPDADLAAAAELEEPGRIDQLIVSVGEHDSGVCAPRLDATVRTSTIILGLDRITVICHWIDEEERRGSVMAYVGAVDADEALVVEPLEAGGEVVLDDNDVERVVYLDPNGQRLLGLANVDLPDGIEHVERLAGWR
jgi:hypothetical protein